MPQKRPKSGQTIDAFDRAILRILQHDNKRPQRLIAEAVNLSAAAVQRRVAAMEEAGVIARNVAVVNPDALGLAITTVVEVQLIDERAQSADAAKALFKSAPEVQHCYYMTGGVSFVLVIVCADMREYEALTRRLFAENDLVERFRTLVALDRVKAETSLIIP